MLSVRELGLPPEVMPGGRRLLHWSFYVAGPEPVLIRIAAAAIVALVLWAAWTAGRGLLRTFWLAGGRRRPEGRLLMGAAALLVVAQVAESAAGWESLQSVMGPLQPIRLAALCLEEGFECLGSLFVLWAAWMSTRPLRAPVAVATAADAKAAGPAASPVLGGELEPRA